MFRFCGIFGVRVDRSRFAFFVWTIARKGGLRSPVVH